MKKTLELIMNILFLLLASVFSGSCRLEYFTPKETVVFSLPAWDENFSCENENVPVLKKWIILVSSAEESRSFEIPGTQKTFSVKVNDTAPLSILAQSVTEEGNEFFHPAGAVFPWQKDLKWEHGFSADVLRSFYESTRGVNSPVKCKKECGKFNWERFLFEIEKKTSESDFFNPWNLDKTSLLSNIFSKNFTLSKLKEKNCVCIRGTELFSEQEAAIIFSDYIPLNKVPAGQQSFNLKKDFTNRFLCTQKKAIITVHIANTDGFSLAINSLPL